MKNRLYILKTVLLTCLMAGLIGVAEVKAAGLGMDLPGDNNKDKTAKKISVSEAYKSNLSLDAGFRFSGVVRPEFNLSPAPTTVKPSFTYKQGNTTYLIPYSVDQTQQVNMNYHHLQLLTWPIKKG